MILSVFKIRCGWCWPFCQRWASATPYIGTLCSWPDGVTELYTHEALLRPRPTADDRPSYTLDCTGLTTEIVPVTELH
jgi:hypothetical protein